MNAEAKEKKFYEPERVKDVMERFGFLYADVNLERANLKSDEYEGMGYSPSVQHKPDGFYVIVNPKTIKDEEEL